MPWSLDADELAAWLEEHWVSRHEPQEVKVQVRKQRKRQAFVKQLTGSDGFGLLTKCTSPNANVPWVKITHTADGEAIRDLERAEELTKFLQARAGLTFYYQLYRSSASIVSPLREFEWVQYVDNSNTAEMSLIRNRQTKEMFGIKFAREGADGRSAAQETALTRQAASQFVVSVHQYSSFGNIFYAIAELCVNRLSMHLDPGKGFENDEFWRLASQLVQGVRDVHSAGVIHLAIQVRSRACGRGYLS